MADKRRNLGIPSGVVFPFAGASAPYGYLVCDGSAISRSDYPSLFAALGTSHGSGDGSTTFNLPDYRGRFMRGVDGTAGNDPDKIGRTAMATGGNTGNTVGSVQGHANESHTHIQDAHNHIQGMGIDAAGAFGSSSVGGSYRIGNDAANYFGPAGVLTSTSTPTNQNSGGNESRPKNVNVNYIVKV